MEKISFCDIIFKAQNGKKSGDDMRIAWGKNGLISIVTVANYGVFYFKKKEAKREGIQGFLSGQRSFMAFQKGTLSEIVNW